jgi:hypothetical protein
MTGFMETFEGTALATAQEALAFFEQRAAQCQEKMPPFSEERQA